MALEKFEIVKSMTGETDYTVVEIYLEVAAQKILSRAYPFAEDKVEVPVKYAMLQCEIAAYLLNKRGAEGQVSHSENGISRGYENADIPESMLAVITPFCGVVGT